MAFLALGVIFLAIGTAGQRNFLGIGAAFLAIGAVFLAQNRRARGPKR